jgi:hypothetical protein
LDEKEKNDLSKSLVRFFNLVPSFSLGSAFDIKGFQTACHPRGEKGIKSSQYL